MAMNIPQDPLSVDPHSLSSKFPSPSKSKSSSTSFRRDALEAASPAEPNRDLSSFKNENPELDKPTSPDSIAGFLRIWLETMRAFRLQLSAAEQVDLKARRQLSQLAVIHAEEFAKLISDREAAIKNLREEINQKLKDLQKILDKMKELGKDQQKKIDAIRKISARL
jgi:hypothetical protein